MTNVQTERRCNLPMCTLASTAVSWSPEGWTTPGDALEAQKTPDPSALVQEVMNRSDWASLNAMTFVISGTGVRIAEAYDGVSNAAPVLRIVYAD